MKKERIYIIVSMTAIMIALAGFLSEENQVKKVFGQEPQYSPNVQNRYVPSVNGYQQRLPSTGPKFAFSSKRKESSHQGKDRSRGKNVNNPPAGAVLTTFLTGHYSEDLIQWQVQRYKQLRYQERQAQMAQERQQAAARYRSLQQQIAREEYFLEQQRLQANHLRQHGAQGAREVTPEGEPQLLLSWQPNRSEPLVVTQRNSSNKEGFFSQLRRMEFSLARQNTTPRDELLNPYGQGYPMMVPTVAKEAPISDQYAALTAYYGQPTNAIHPTTIGAGAVLPSDYQDSGEGIQLVSGTLPADQLPEAERRTDQNKKVFRPTRNFLP